MSFLAWTFVAGGLLLLLALAAAYVQDLPAAPSVVYLIAGFLLGPKGFGVLNIRLPGATEWLDPLLQVGVVIALFFGGLKLRADWRAPQWRAAYWLAGPGMLGCIGLLTLAGWAGLGLDVPVALLLAAMLSPTDPLLSELVTVGSATDRDRVRFGLTGESGLNDGLAFPFVVLALGLLRHEGNTGWLLEWFAGRELWGTVGGLVIGYFVGRGGGLLAIRFRSRQGVTSAPSDFLALALIAIAFAVTQAVGAIGFLAAFASGVGMRSAEVRTVERFPHPEVDDDTPGERHPPAEHLVEANLTTQQLRAPAVAAGVVVSEMVSFGDTAERLLTFLLVAVMGVLLGSYWDARAIPLALVLFVVIRPLVARLVLANAPLRESQRWLMGWFGIRGMASLYFAVYIMTQRLDRETAGTVASLTISVIALSVLVHGLSTPAIMAWYSRKQNR